MNQYECLFESNDGLDLIEALDKSGREYYDRRDRGGCLWIVGKYDVRD